MMLQISGLTKRYDDETGLGRAALDRIDLEVNEHEAVTLEHFPVRLHRILRRRDSWRILVG